MIHFHFVIDNSIVSGLFVRFLYAVEVIVTHNNNHSQLLAVFLFDRHNAVRIDQGYGRWAMGNQTQLMPKKKNAM